MASFRFRRDTLPEDVARLFGEGMPPPLVPTTEAAAPPFPAPAVRNLPLDTLPADCLFVLHQHVPVQLILRLVCKAMRDAHGRTKTQLCDVVVSPKLAEWARSVGYPSQGVGTGVMARKAVAGGRMETIVYLRAQSSYPSITDLDLCRLACYHGQLETLQWLRKHGFQWDGHCAHVAAQNGHLETLKWARQNGCPFCMEAVEAATNGNHIECVRWLCTHDKGLVNGRTLRWAAVHGNLEMIRLQHSFGAFAHNHCVYEAARQGQLACLQYFVVDMEADHSFHYLMDAALATSKMNIDLVHWVLARYDAGEWEGFSGMEHPFNYRCIESAAAHGHMEVLELARQRGCWGGKYTEGAMGAAAEGDNIETLKWLRKHGCVWNEDTCAQAARFGALGALKWLREQGCPWDFETVEVAVVHSDLETVQWICHNWDKGPAGCLPFCETHSHIQDLNRGLTNKAARHGQTEILIWLVANGCEYDLQHLETAAHQTETVMGEPPCRHEDRTNVLDFLKRLAVLRQTCGPGFERFLQC